MSFSVLAVENNVFKYRSESQLSILLDIYPEMGLPRWL